MAMWINTGLVILLGVAVVLALTLALYLQRLMRFRWKAVRSQVLARQDVPTDARAILDKAAGQLTALGFSHRISGSTTKALVTPDDAPVFFDLYQHADGHTHAWVSPSPVPEGHAPCLIQLVTCLDNGNWVTINRFRHYSPPMVLPRWRAFDDYFPDWIQAWHRHLARVQAAGAAVCTDGVEVHRRLHESVTKLVPEMVLQGILVPVEGSDHFRMAWWPALKLAVGVLVGQWRAAWALRGAGRHDTQDDAAAPVAGVDSILEADVRAIGQQLALQRSTASTAKGKLLVFAATALLFLAVGSIWMSWQFVPILLAVIALHEGGHYLAMKLTGYRNVSVFFLPGLGGLATGEKAAATPFEKLFVYLAGPVPGIVLAGLAFWAASAGVWVGPSWLNEFLIASLLINYLNLLPVVPLDGGRVVETLVFARHPRLRFGFAALCCALLFGAGLYLDDWVLRLVAVLVAFGLPGQWRLMRLDQAIERVPGQASDEPQAIRQILSALQTPRFQGWPFARRSAAVSALLPELMGRRAGVAEAVAGLLIYFGVLVGPIAVALVAVPQLGQVASMFVPGLGVAKDDVDPEPANATPKYQAPERVDWNARLAQAASLSRAELLQAHLGAARMANEANDLNTARSHSQAAWELAQSLAPRDPARVDALEELALVAEQETQRNEFWRRIVAELDSPVGVERLRVARAKEQLSYDEADVSARVRLLQESVALRQAASPPYESSLQMAQLALARALDAAADIEQALNVLNQRVAALPLPAANDRSRKALDVRVQRVNHQMDAAWFLMAHGRFAQARPVIENARSELPDTITTSWVMPRQQVLEAIVWAQLLSQPASTMAADWKAYDAAVSNAPGMALTGGRKLLFHEADRGLVAQKLKDDTLMATARSGVAQAVAGLSRRPPMLCVPPHENAMPNWRRPQQDERRRILVSLGACKDN